MDRLTQRLLALSGVITIFIVLVPTFIERFESPLFSFDVSGLNVETPILVMGLLIGITFLVLPIISNRFFTTAEVRQEEAEGHLRKLLDEARRELSESIDEARTQAISREGSLKETDRASLLDELEDRFADRFSEEARSELRKSRRYRQIEQTIRAIRSNFLDYRASNRSQYLINLFFGLFIGSAGILVIGEPIVSGRSLSEIRLEDGTIDVSAGILNYVPRLTFALLVFTLAFYFLRLYKSNIATERYLRDEITTIDFKLLAVEIALGLEDDLRIEEAIPVLHGIDRHQILEAGQISVELEKEKFQAQSNAEVLDYLASFNPTELLKAMAKDTADKQP